MIFLARHAARGEKLGQNTGGDEKDIAGAPRKEKIYPKKKKKKKKKSETIGAGVRPFWLKTSEGQTVLREDQE